MKKQILEFLKTNKKSFVDKNDMILFFAGKFNISAKQSKEAVLKLFENGDIVEDKPNRFVVLSKTNYKKGKMVGNARGFGFCEIIGEKCEDFFIPPKKLNGALNDDIVIIKPLAQTEESTEAEVVSVIKRANSTIVGTFAFFNGKDAFVVPNNKKVSKDIFVPRKFTNGAKDNDTVVVKVNFSKPDGKLSGEVIEILGQSNDIQALEMSIIRQHKLYEEFPQTVINEAKKIAQQLTEKDLKNRLNLTKKQIFTIDGADARDLDDAISLEMKGNNYYLGVHIADVGHYVPFDKCLDHEAYLRGTSVYFPNMVLPMLPTELSNGICSLNPRVDRLTLSVFMEIDKDGNVVSSEIFESVINSCERLTYDEVYGIITGDRALNEKYSHISATILQMNKLSEILEKRRIEAGMLDLDIAESYIVLDDNLKPSFMKKRDRNEAHKLIENFMVVCNETVAKKFCTKGSPFVYRVHEKPVIEKVKDVCLFLNGLGISTKEVKEVTPAFIQKLLKQTQNKQYSEIVSKVILRSLQKAKYHDDCMGHFGLALEYYCHFTSPIRRYPDLVIHRIIKETLLGAISGKRLDELKDFVVDASFRSSETEKNADEAERDVDDLFKAVYMSEHLNEDFDAIISGVTNYGFYVELENTVEGLVRLETLPQDTYLFFEKSLKLKGNSHTYKLGDKVRVKCVMSNITERKVEFVLI